MSNLQPPSPLESTSRRLSDARAAVRPAPPVSAEVVVSAALRRRNAILQSHRSEARRAWERTHNSASNSDGSAGRSSGSGPWYNGPWYRRPLPNLARHNSSSNLSVSTPAVESLDEPPSKRRRPERTGQVQMEQLPMELRYCDGGRYDGHSHAGDYSPECALRDDASVYCTKNSRCNMILRHVNGECFSLQKLVIRAPSTGYTSPVRAGMIFVTMEDADLLHRTSYTVHYESDDDEGDTSSDDEFFLGRSPWDPTTEPDSEPYSPVNPVTWGSQYFRGAAHLPPRDTGTPASPPSASPLWENLDEQINQSRPPPAQLLEPNAIFNHKVRKSKCVINFEPAISGRYILAKFFATPDQKNIDIEFIGAYGWAGRRFFPAVAIR